MTGGNTDHYTTAELEASLRSCWKIMFLLLVVFFFVVGLWWGRGGEGVSERVVVRREGCENPDGTAMGGAGLNFSGGLSVCLCTAVLLHNVSF